MFSQRYERGSTLVTTNLPFDEWTEVFGSERLTGEAPRSPHPPRQQNLEMNGDSYRLNQAAGVKPRLLTEPTTQPTLDPVGPQVPPARAAASAC